VFSSKYLSNCRILSSLVPWTQISGKPDFSSDGARNDSIGIAGVSIGTAGLLMSGFSLLDKNGKLTNALSDTLRKMTLDPTDYFKLNDPGSYIHIGDSTTRVSKDRLLFKTGTFSNMILNPANLSYSNAIFSLCNQIAFTATSISNLTHTSISSNLTVSGSISTNSNIGVGTTTQRYGLEINKALPTIGLNWGPSNKGRIDFDYSTDPVLGSGACARIEVSDDVNYSGHMDFQTRVPGSATSNLPSRLFIKSSGLIGVNNSTPLYNLDIVGSANVSTTLTSATHSNSGNFQTNTLTIPGINVSSYTASFPINTSNLVQNISQYSAITCSVAFDISMSVSGSSQTMVKDYKFACGYGSTGGGWRKVLPSSVSYTNPDAYELLVYNNNNGITQLRVVHSQPHVNSTVSVNIIAKYSQNDTLTVSNLTGNSQTTDSNWATYGFLHTTMITQTGNLVGVGKSTPSYELDIAGLAKVSSNMYVSSRLGIGTTSPGYALEVVGTTVLSMFAGSLSFAYLTSLPALLSNSSILGWSNILGAPSYVGVSNTSLPVYSLQTPSNNMRIYTSNLVVGCGSDPNLATHVWNNGVDGAQFGSNEGGLASWWGVSFRCLTDNTDRHVFDCRTGDNKFVGALSNMGDASFSSNVVVGSGLTAYSLTTTDLFADNTISAQAGISSRGDIVSQFNGGGNVGTSGTPWGSINTLTASLGDATMTSLSNSGVVSLTSGDSDKIILTGVGSDASKISHSSGWNLNYYAGYNNATQGQHNFYTAYNGGFTNQMYVHANAVNVTNKLAVNQSVDSGVGRGIWWWNDGDANWTSYFSSSGGTRSSSGGAACTSLDGRTAPHHRARSANSATQGWLWENNAEQCLMSLTPDSGNLYVRSLVQTSNINVGQTLTAAILKGSLDYNYLSNVPSLGTLAQSTFESNAGAFGSNSGVFGSNTSVWSSNNCVKGNSLSNTNYPIMITTTTPRIGILWNGGTSGSLNFGFSTSAFQGSLETSARIREDDNNYSASLSFQTRTPGSDNLNMNTRMVVQSTSNVGINTTSPGCLLDVAGSARFVDTAITGLLTCSNGLAMKTNSWMTGTDNTNRMYFATSADTTFSAPNGQYNFLNNTGATSIQITSNLGINYPQSDPGFFCSSSYGTKPSLDIFGYGQFSLGHIWDILCRLLQSL
jgi:hypothetical protein